MSDPNPFLALLRSRKFWLAVLAMAQTILFQFVPSFPPAVWQSIDAVLLIVIVTIAGEDMAEKRANVRFTPDDDGEEYTGPE